MDRSLAEFGVCLALFGGFFADIDGDGDEFDDVTPLVWMPGGTGRLALVAPFCCTTGLAGAIVARDATKAVSVLPPLSTLS